MYDELVKRLRNGLSCYGEKCLSCTDKKHCVTHYEHEAADAIEELQGRAKVLEKVADKWCEAVPKWIPVAERLPEQRINQNTLDFEYVLCATTFGDVRPYKYGRRIGQGDAHFWNGAGYVDAYVTHWMPLPEPPKEET